MTTKIPGYITTDDAAKQMKRTTAEIARLCRAGKIKNAVQVKGWLIPEDWTPPTAGRGRPFKVPAEPPKDAESHVSE